MTEPAVFRYTSPTEYLKDWLAFKKSKNASFSLSSLARLLAVGQPLLSMVLAGKRPFSVPLAEKVCERLKLAGPDEEYFLGLVDLSLAETQTQRKKISARLAKLKPRERPLELRLDEFAPLSRWYALALLEVCDLAPIANKEIAKISDKIRVPEERIADTLDKLCAAGLVERQSNGAYRRRPGEVIVKADIPSDEVNAFHAQMLERAREVLPRLKPEQRIFSSDFIPMSRADLEELRGLVYRFLDEVHDFSKRSRDPDAVYGLTVGAFEIYGGRKD